jgi:uroporphyrinogen-III synthase
MTTELWELQWRNNVVPGWPRRIREVTTPLQGRSVVITRSHDQNASLRRLLEAQGATVIEVPLLAISEPDDEGRERDVVLQRFHEFDWIVVTSPNGADRVAPFLSAAVAAGDTDHFPHVAAVGEATHRSLNSSAHLVADPARAEVLVEMFPKGQGTVLVVQGNLADDFVERGISAKGWTVTRVVAYRTVQLQPDPDKKDLALSADALLLASSSAASAWCDAFGTQGPDVVVAMGPSTAKTAQALGLHVSAIASEQTLSALIDATSHVLATR